jgi:ubiquinone/menaquinone biosynthesis C-methylase UbiE
MSRMIDKTSHGEKRAGLAQRLFAWMHSTGDLPDYDEVVNPRKRALLGGLTGTVLEIGAGTGENFPFYPKDIHWIGIEPNAYMHDDLLANAREHGIQGELRAGTAEALDMPDNSVDAVVSTLVMCSVGAQDVALRQILRVLKPGGCYCFMEHVGAPQGTGLRRLQRGIKPIWRVFADGCTPDRDTADAIRRAGFASVEIEAFDAPVWVASPHIAGCAVK